MRLKYLTLFVLLIILAGVAEALHEYGIQNLWQIEPNAYSLEKGTEQAKEVSEEMILQEFSRDSHAPGDVRIPIIIYHNVRPDYPSESGWVKEYSITPDILDAEFAFLQKNGYTVISMDELAKDVQAGTTTPVQKPVVLTFDDGWESQYQYAFPLLQKYHYTATFYIYTNAVSHYGAYMTWDQVRVLEQSGMTIGDHTLSHPHLSDLTSQQLHTEIGGAQSILQEQLGIPIHHFASPYGYSSDAIDQELQNDGFITGRTTYKGTAHGISDLLHLRAYLVHRSYTDFVKFISS
jgi:peptidoglycan/xylan/chitin deacetylase (PgdA/CDA1 family)